MGWMRGLANTRTLRNIVIPGSHDAGLWRVAGHGLRSGHVVTQLYDIRGQLDHGCRLFDFRVFNYNATGRTTAKDLRFGHFAEKVGFIGGRGNSMMGRFGPKLIEALDDVTDFLDDNPYETVILRFSHINADNRPLVVDTVKDRLDRYLYTTNAGGQLNLCTIPLGQRGGLHSLRGKVLAIFDRGDGFQREPDEGIFTYHSFKKVDTVPDLDTEVDLHLCGEYSNKSSYPQMRQLQLDRRAEHHNHRVNGNQDHLFVCYFTLTSGVKNIYDMTSPHFRRLPTFLDELLKRGAHGSGANVVMMDFIKSERCNRVIRRGNLFNEAYMAADDLA